MAVTVRMMVTTQWQRMSNGQCEMQSVNDRDAFNKLLFDLVIGDEMPSADTDASARITLATYSNFHRPAPVWLRLNAANADKDQPVIVIKEGEL